MKDISIINRTKEKCIFLKKKFNNLKVLNWEELEEKIKNYDIIINATSLGLKNGQDFEFNFDKTKKNLMMLKINLWMELVPLPRESKN